MLENDTESISKIKYLSRKTKIKAECLHKVKKEMKNHAMLFKLMSPGDKRKVIDRYYTSAVVEAVTQTEH